MSKYRRTPAFSVLHKLNEECAAQGYRLLDPDEVGPEFRQAPALKELEACSPRLLGIAVEGPDWNYGMNQGWDNGGNQGYDECVVYRTKLSRATLRAIRGLPPECGLKVYTPTESELNDQLNAKLLRVEDALNLEIKMRAADLTELKQTKARHALLEMRAADLTELKQTKARHALLEMRNAELVIEKDAETMRREQAEGGLKTIMSRYQHLEERHALVVMDRAALQREVEDLRGRVASEPEVKRKFDFDKP